MLFGGFGKLSGRPAIVIDGGDSTTKTTNCLLVAKILETGLSIVPGYKFPVAYVSLPVYELPWGRVVGDYLGRWGPRIDNISPRDTAWIYALNRLEIANYLDELYRRNYLFVFNRSPLSNTYNVARELLAESRNWDGMSPEEKRDAVESVLSFDRVPDGFYDLINRYNVPLINIILDLGVERSLELSTVRAQVTGRHKDAHEADFDLQRLTQQIYREMGLGMVPGISARLVEISSTASGLSQVTGRKDGYDAEYWAKHEGILKNIRKIWQVVSTEIWGDVRDLDGWANNIPSYIGEILRAQQIEHGVDFEFRRLLSDYTPLNLEVTHKELMDRLRETNPGVFEAQRVSQQIEQEMGTYGKERG